MAKRAVPVRRRSARGVASAARASAAPLDPRRWYRRFLRNAAVALPAAIVFWLLLTPFYNVFLRHAGERLVRLGERPAVTRLLPETRHTLIVTRADLRGRLRLIRVTDIHFPLVLLGLLFLATPGLPPGRRLETLGWALLVAVFFHLLSLVAWVKFVYATQLGAWSSAHYGAVRQNVYGLAKHLLDLPFKLALPVLLWSVFHLREVPALRLQEAGREGGAPGGS